MLGSFCEILIVRLNDDRIRLDDHTIDSSDRPHVTIIIERQVISISDRRVPGDRVGRPIPYAEAANYYE